MGNAAMATPAFLFRIDHGDQFFVASYAVCLEYFCAMFGQLDPFRCVTGIEEDRVLHAVYRLPDVMNSQVLVRQVAIHAAVSAVRSGMQKGGMLALHDMASRAKTGRVGFRQYLGWSNQQECRHHQCNNTGKAQHDPTIPVQKIRHAPSSFHRFFSSSFLLHTVIASSHDHP
jgi:hypothetical protein